MNANLPLDTLQEAAALHLRGLQELRDQNRVLQENNAALDRMLAKAEADLDATRIVLADTKADRDAGIETIRRERDFYIRYTIEIATQLRTLQKQGAAFNDLIDEIMRRGADAAYRPSTAPAVPPPPPPAEETDALDDGIKQIAQKFAPRVEP